MMQPPLQQCHRCGNYFQPLDPNECLCGICDNHIASNSVLLWFIAFAATVIGILAYHFFK